VAANRLATVSWAAPDDGGTPITGYSVMYSTNGVAWLTASTSVPPTATSYTVTNLTNGSGYYFKVSAQNLAGAGAFSLAVGAFTPYTFADRSPAVTATPAKQAAVVKWSAPAANGSAITGYQIDYRRSDRPAWVTYLRNTRSAATTRTVTGLVAGKGYVFRVRAINAAGVGPVSVTSKPVVPYTVPSAPTRLAAWAGRHAVGLGWVAPSSGGRRITGYQILYSLNHGATWKLYGSTKPTTQATARGLVTGRTYWFRVRAVSAAGIGTLSASSTGVRVK
jgi:titin